MKENTNSKKRVLITGASSGIGFELAKLYGKNGYDLILVARRNDKLDHLKKDIESAFGVDVRVISMDLAKSNSADVLYNAIRHLRVDILINNAGMASFGEFHKANLDTEEEIINLNVLSVVKLCHAYSNAMIEQGGGTIINISSTASFQPGPLMSNYYASKAYVLSFTEALNKELKEKNVNVFAYCPGPTRTEFLEKTSANKNQIKKESMKSPRFVAEDIFKKSLTNTKPVVIQGKRYKTAVFFERFLPRNTRTNIVYNIQKKRK
ncbi:MAG: SDR family oxidoreductase [Clostridia bacterium]|nr:SDR family oxidoreductase [Clostridia bacterium]